MQILEEVTRRAEEAETIKEEVEKVRDKAQALVNDIAKDKSLAEEKLEAARPALEEAEAALNTIKPAHIGNPLLNLLPKPVSPLIIMKTIPIISRVRIIAFYTFQPPFVSWAGRRTLSCASWTVCCCCSKGMCSQSNLIPSLPVPSPPGPTVSR